MTGSTADDDSKLSFEQAHRKYNDKIYQMIFRLVGSEDEARELTLETFLNAWRAWDKRQGDVRVSTWLHQIAVNNCKNRYKQRGRQSANQPPLDEGGNTSESGEVE